MFHSQSLLSRKGPLGLLWIAAYCYKRLKKPQVAGADLLAFIGKIILDDFPLVSSRILGTLLLGVSRIYSMQVGYLLEDCHTALNEIGHFVKNKVVRKQMDALIIPPPSIVLPERFELDSFNLEVNSDCVERDNMRLSEHMMEEDDWRNETIGNQSLIKLDDALDVFTAASNTHGECNLPSISGYPSKDAEYSVPNFKVLRGKLSPEDGNIHGDMFLGADEELLDLITQSAQKKFNHGAQMNQRDELQIDELQTLDVIGTEFHDVVIDGNSTKMLLDDRGLEKCPEKVPTRLEECAETSVALKYGAGFSDFVTVATPTRRENDRNRQKRKCQIDDVIVLPNKFVKASLEDATDLVCKRRKAPHTALGAWRALQISNLSDTSFPLFPYCFTDLQPRKWDEALEVCRHQDESMAADGVALSPSFPPPLAVLDMQKPGSPATDKNDEPPLIAPDTPVDFPSSRRFQKGVKPSYGEESTSSSECMCKESLIINRDTDLNLIEEETCNDEGNTNEGGRWSWRTRRLAEYLQKSFGNQKQYANEPALSMFNVLKGKGRKDSARLFYEILVLKTEGCVDVVQDDAYGDILLLPTHT